MCTNGRRTSRSHISRWATRLGHLCLGVLSLYDGEETMVTMYDTEQPRVNIPVGIFLTPAARLSHTARTHRTNMSDDPPNLAYFIIALSTICYLYQFF
jgi:hypothetical protein